MAVRLPSSLSKILLVAVVALLLTGGITYAAEQQAAAPTTPAAAQPAPQKQVEIVVPDLRRQAFVFAKGALQDAGLAWRVVGPVRGYPANVVVSQSPDAGTKVIDTGAPLVTLTLSRNTKYAQHGRPEDVSPYAATPVRLADAPVLPAATTTATTTTAATKTTPTPAPAPAKAPAKAPAAPAAKLPQHRPPAFEVAGAPKEPLDELPLPDRARALARWIETKPKPTDANVKRWLYQNEWIVTGAKFGWWRGAEALRIVIAADRRTETVWGIGSRSRLLAARALTEVEARAR